LAVRFDEAMFVGGSGRFPARDRFPRSGARSQHEQFVVIRDLNIRFTGRAHRACRERSRLFAGEGEVLGLLGEIRLSKKRHLRALMRLLEEATQISGSVQVLGATCWRSDDEELSAFRGQTVSMIFQEPALALDRFSPSARDTESVMRHEAEPG